MEGIKRKNKFGISLIVLVITILVMIILAGVVIVNMAENNPIEKAREASFKENLTEIGKELEMFLANKYAENQSFDKYSLNATYKTCTYNTNKTDKTIYNVLPSLQSSKYKKQIEIVQGSLFYKSPDKKEIAWLKDMGIHYTGIVTGTVIIEGDTLVGVSADYVNTGTLIIPSTVKKIKKGAFAGCEELNAVMFQMPTDPNEPGITEIPIECFAYCTGLTAVTLPETVTNIKEDAFRGCTALKSITLPRDLEHIGPFAFYNSSNLANVTFNDKLSVIDKYAFSNTSLASLDIKGETLEKIGELAFQKTNLVNVTLPNSVTQIDAAAFVENKNLTELHIGSKAKIAPGIIRQCIKITSFTVDANNPYHKTIDNVLYGLDENKNIVNIQGIPANATTITVPNTVTEIAPSTFIDATSLVTVTLHNNITKIGDRAFENCTSLVNLTIPASVTQIGGKVFENCSSLTNLVVEEGNSVYKAQDKMLYSKDGTTIYSCPDVHTSYTIPDTVTTIAQDAFARCGKLQTVTIGKGISVIPVDCFRGSGLVKVTVPGTVKRVKWGAFRYSKKLQEVILEEGVEFLEGSLFLDCYELAKVKISSTVKEVPGTTLNATKKLADVQVSKDNAYVTTNGTLDTKTGYITGGTLVTSKDGKVLYTVTDSKATVIVPKGVEVVARNAFTYNDANLTRIEFPTTLTKITESSTNSCNRLKTILIPHSVHTIEANAFINTPNLTQIFIDQKQEGNPLASGSPWGASQGIKAVIWK